MGGTENILASLFFVTKCRLDGLKMYKTDLLIYVRFTFLPLCVCVYIYIDILYLYRYIYALISSLSYIYIYIKRLKKRILNSLPSRVCNRETLSFSSTWSQKIIIHLQINILGWSYFTTFCLFDSFWLIWNIFFFFFLRFPCHLSVNSDPNMLAFS